MFEDDECAFVVGVISNARRRVRVVIFALNNRRWALSLASMTAFSTSSNIALDAQQHFILSSATSYNPSFVYSDKAGDDSPSLYFVITVFLVSDSAATAKTGMENKIMFHIITAVNNIRKIEGQ